MPTKLKYILTLGIPIGLTIILSVVLQITILKDQQAITSWMGEFGPFILLVYIILQIITIIIAPIGGFFLQIALLSLFDPAFAWALIYMVTTPLYCVNFIIARKWGRPLVQKIIGNDALTKIDHYAKDLGVFTLIVFRIFQGGIFDYLSYAVGLTKIPFKTFLLVNVLGGIPFYLSAYYIFTRFNNFIHGITASLVTAYVLAGLAFVINHYVKKHKK